MLWGLRMQFIFVEPKSKLVMVHTAAGDNGPIPSELLALWSSVVKDLAENHALESTVLERMVLDVHGEAFVLRVRRRSTSCDAARGAFARGRIRCPAFSRRPVAFPSFRACRAPDADHFAWSPGPRRSGRSLSTLASVPARVHFRESAKTVTLRELAGHRASWHPDQSV